MLWQDVGVGVKSPRVLETRNSPVFKYSSTVSGPPEWQVVFLKGTIQILVLF